jgi:predicted HicB family RNase H-like nuclease
MKRVIDGVTYNTDTSTMIARAEEDHEFNSYTGEAAKSLQVVLYQTRGGAFFLHTYTETSRQNAEGEWRDIVRNEFDPMTASEARHWITNSRHQVEVLNDVFGEPPEAAAEESPGKTIYLRVPASLKDQIEAAAETEKLSVNSWAMRCMESCLANRNAGIVPISDLGGGYGRGIV